MKVLEIDYDKYIYPDGVSTPEGFGAFLMANSGGFVEMLYFSSDNCIDPYYIEEEVGRKYINPAMVSVFRECEVTVLPREEYDRRLADLEKNRCVHCANYEINGGECCDNIRDNLCLDGKCWNFEAFENQVERQENQAE
ncbi:MAG: hypothetical protein IJM51_05520 [Clostridia bacterium]|nr:hypothetical protein [Clostridia bacterium]